MKLTFHIQFPVNCCIPQYRYTVSVAVKRIQEAEQDERTEEKRLKKKAATGT